MSAVGWSVAATPVLARAGAAMTESPSAQLSTVAPATPPARVAPGDLTAPVGVTMESPTTAQSTVTSTKFGVAWKGTDTGSGVASYDVRVRTAAWNTGVGAFTPWKSATTATSATFSASAGHTFCFSVRARDKDANVSSWSADRCTSVPLDDAGFSASSFSRLTRVRGMYLGTLSSATKSGATLTRTGAVARSITLIARTCSTCGAVAVRWNGKTVKTVSLVGATATRSIRVATFAKPTKGTLQIVVTSNKKLVAVDAVSIATPSLSGTVTLNAGAVYTGKTPLTVTAAVAGATGAVQMRLANGTAAGGGWVAFRASLPFTLSAADGTKTVAAQFKDAGGNVSTVALAVIVLDTVAPSVVVSPGAAEVANGTDVAVTATVTDASPLAAVTLATATLGTTDPPVDAPMTLSAGAFHATVAAPTESFDYTVTATDAAGNASVAPATAPESLYRVTVDPVVTAQDAIADALAAGTMDYPTSLLYRTWALFGDPRLPDAYYAGGNSGEDDTLFTALQDLQTRDPSAVPAGVQPYLVRPDSPDSAFGPEPQAGSSLRRAVDPLAGPLDAPLEGPLDAHCPTSWESDSGAHFKVSSCGIDDLLRQKVLSAAENVYGPETGVMGTEISDGSATDNGGDGLIDIYIVDTLSCRERGDTCTTVPDDDAAVTFATDPCLSGPLRCAAYIDINVQEAQSSEMAGTIAHEFFHVLQTARDRDAMFQVDGADPPVWHEHWFTEATATWAGWKFAHASYMTKANGRYADFQSDPSISLLTEGYHPYTSWTWPLLMEQSGGANAIGAVWKNAGPVTTAQAFDDAINAQFDFKTNFREFAVKNLDRDLPGSPYQTWQSGADGAGLTPDVTPTATTNENITGMDPEVVSTVTLPVLSAQYDTYFPDPDIGKITFDFTNIQHPENLDVDIIAKERADGQWRRIKVDTTQIDFCQDVEAQDFSVIKVVLSNHKDSRGADGFQPDDDQEIVGDYSVKVGQCDSVSATLGYNFTSSGTVPNSNIDQHYQESATFDVNMSTLDLGPGIPTPYQLVDDGSTFSVNTHYTLDSVDDQGCETFTTVDGSGDGTTPVTDPFHPATVGINAADPTDPFERGDTAVFSYVITYDIHGQTQSSGPPDTCANDTTDVDLTTQTQLFTCVPEGVTADLGGGLYGTYQPASHSYLFTCSANNVLSPFGVPGTVSVSGQVVLTGT